MQKMRELEKELAATRKAKVNAEAVMHNQEQELRRSSRGSTAGEIFKKKGLHIDPLTNGSSLCHLHASNHSLKE